LIKLFTLAKTQTGEGEDLKTEYQVAGNVSLLEAQQMLTEFTIAKSKAEGSKQVKAEDDKQASEDDKGKSGK